MKWFKFYGQDFLTDSKIGALNPLQKLLWVVLLCIASQDEEKTGIIKFLTEERLKELAGITDNPFNDDWQRTNETLETFCNMGLVSMPDQETIIIVNYEKMQQQNMTSTERVQAFRARQKDKIEAKKIETHETKKRFHETQNETLDKNRKEEDKNNIKEINKEKVSASINYLKNIPKEDLKEFSDAYLVDFSGIIKKAQDLVNYCEMHGKRYKNYKALLRNAISKDFKVREKKVGMSASEMIEAAQRGGQA